MNLNTISQNADIESQKKRIASKASSAANLLKFNLALSESKYKLTPESIYRGINVKVALVCPNDHFYNVRPNCFMSRGSRCPACRDFRSSHLGKYPDDAIKLFLDTLKARGDTLSPMASYKGNHKNIDIICRNGHAYSVTPGNYKRGQKCIQCRGRHPHQVKQRFFDTLKMRGAILAKDSIYVNSQTHLFVQCKKGHIEKKVPESYIKGLGCTACSGKCSKEAALSIDALLVERGYSKGLKYKYKSMADNIDLICDKGHSFRMKAQVFKRGSGCSQCALTGFDSGKPATLYYIKFVIGKAREVYKIGVTNSTVDKRYSYLAKSKRPKILQEYCYLKGGDAMEEEQKIKRKFSQFRCKDKPISYLSNTEIFDVDIFAITSFPRIGKLVIEGS